VGLISPRLPVRFRPHQCVREIYVSGIAQSAEHPALNRKAEGSIPSPWVFVNLERNGVSMRLRQPTSTAESALIETVRLNE
jgi:hypothetical protein